MDYRKSWEETLENQRNLLTAKVSMASAKHSADLQWKLDSLSSEKASTGMDFEFKLNYEM
jgi:hypothetical protein